MVELRRFNLVDVLLFLLVLAAAAGARFWYLAACTDYANTPGPLLVQDPSPEFGELARHLKESQTFKGLAPLAAAEERTAHVAPGYPVLLALLEMSPLDLSPVDRTMRWIQCGLGALTAGFYFLFARRAFRNLTVATLAGLLCALNPFGVVNTAEINDGVVASFLLAACLGLGARGGEIGGPLTSWLYGLLLAALALVRAALLPFAFVAVLWFLLRARTLPRGWLYAFLAFLGFATGLTPWTFQNFRAFGDVLPVVDSTYLHLWIGNNPRATGGLQDEATLRALLNDEKSVSLVELERMDQPRRYRQLASLALQEVQDKPTATLRRRLHAGLYFLFGERWFDKGELAQPRVTEEPNMPVWLVQSHPLLFHGSLLAMLLLGLLGWRWTYGWRISAMPSSLALLWVPLPYLLSHAETLSGPRLPLDGVLLTYAAFALVCLLPPLGNQLLQGGEAAPPPDDRMMR